MMDENTDPYALYALPEFFTKEEIKKFIIPYLPDIKNEGKVDIMYKFLEYLEELKESDFEKYIELICLINKKILNKLENETRVVGITYFDGFTDVDKSNVDEFVDHFFKGEIDSNNISQARPELNMQQLVQHHVYSNNENQVTGIELTYVRTYMKELNDDKSIRTDFTRVVFDFVTKKASFYFGYDKVGMGNFNIHPEDTFMKLKERLEKWFNIYFSYLDTDNAVFKFYKGLTEKNEKSYYDELVKIDHDSNNNHSKIEEFYIEMCDMLNTKLPGLMGKIISENNKKQYLERITRIFMRKIIEDDFEHFKQKILDKEAVIKGFIFVDPLGSSVQGKDGNQNDDTDPLESSNTYLDTRESIYNERKLKSLRIKFNPKDARYYFEKHVRFSAFQNLIIVRFLRKPVSKELEKYAIHEFGKFVQ